MSEKTRKKNLLAFWLAMASSLFLFISGTTGVANWMEIEDLVLKYTGFEWINILFILLFVVASFGGLAVFIGGILILREKHFFGKLLISLGSGAGIFGFFFNLYISIITFNLSVYSYLSFSSFGVIFALLAQLISTKGVKIKKKSLLFRDS